MNVNEERKEKVLLLGVHTGRADYIKDTTDESMRELAELAETAGAEVVGECVQNKADIEKLIQQNKVDIESLKEKHRLEMEKKDKEYQHQIELINLQHKNELQKDEENVKNQMTANVIGGLLGGIFSEQSPVSNRLNEVISNALEEVEKKEEK